MHWNPGGWWAEENESAFVNAFLIAINFQTRILPEKLSKKTKVLIIASDISATKNAELFQ